MIINRDNYENFFLLYVDGELSAVDRKAVEDFAAKNEDLQKELNILKATVLPNEDILFESKGELYRPVPIDALLQEKLLLKIDNELPVNEEASLNELITRDENVGVEFVLLQRTVLDAEETIVFADKESLYRREKESPVIPIFFRWAAAAILIGFGLFFGVNLLQNKAGKEVARTNVPVIKTDVGHDPQNINPFKDQAIASVTPVKTAPDQLTDNSTNSSNSNNATQSTGTTPAHKTDRQKEIKKEDDQNLAQQSPQPVLQKRNENDLPVPYKSVEPNIQLATVSQPKQAEIIDKPSMVPLNTEDHYAKVASLTDNDKSENKILYMDEDDVKRSKAGGLFRKVKRFVERTARIKTGSSIQIAGFEIAAK